MEIIPAILTNSIEEAKAMLSLTDNIANRTQIDIIDGIFANNKTIFPESLEDEIYTTKLDLHLMVKDPIRWIERCVRANADRVIGQIEHMEDQEDFVREVNAKGMMVGLGVDLPTDILDLDQDILAMVDLVLVMSVEAGFGGQTYNKIALEKIKKLDELRRANNFSFKICDDGGVTLQNEINIDKAGADEVAIGRRLFEGDLVANIDNFKKQILR